MNSSETAASQSKIRGDLTEPGPFSRIEPPSSQAPWGRKARDYLRKLLGKGPVTVRIIAKDKYKRSVAEVWKDAANANLEMVKTGKRAVYWHYCRLLAYGLAEWNSRSANPGIWRQTGSHQSPWEYRH